MQNVSYDRIQRARERFDESVVQHTPVDRSRSISDRAGANVFMKMEHLQRTGSFKTRGASNKLRAVSEDDGVEEVVAASAGNHAQGVALAATEAGYDSTIVMPTDAPQAKVNATRSYGADVVLHGTDFQQAMAHARELGEREANLFVPAYDDPDIIEGQGTVGLEIVEDVPDVDTVVVPIGGGGLVSGIGVALSERRPDVRLVGVQAESAATVPTSLKKGIPQDRDSVDTIADGIATGGISELTLGLIEDHVDEIVTVSDEEIARSILLLLERAKQLVEGAGAASVAAVISDGLDVAGETVVPLLSGGNLDMSMLQTLLTHELTSRSRTLRLRVRIDDEAGVLEEISGAIGERSANIRTVHHYRADDLLDVGEAFVVFLVETSGDDHASAIVDSIESLGYEVTRVN